MKTYRKPVVWSPTALEMFIQCPRKYHFSCTKKITSGNLVKGSFIHKKIENFWVFKNNEYKPKYKSAKAWANAIKGQFSQVIKRGVYRGEKIKWKDKNEPWIIRDNLMKICKLNYDRLVEEGPSLISEYNFKKIQIGNRYIRGRIDDIREGMRIRDYKTGYVKKKNGEEIKRINGEEDKNWQFTFYVAAFCIETRFNKEFRKKVGIEEKKVLEWEKNNVIVSPEVNLEYYLLESEDPVVKVRPKNHKDYIELCQLIDFQTMLYIFSQEQNEYPAYRNSYNCKNCIFSKECDEMTEKIEKKGRFYQLYFSDVIATFSSKISKSPLQHEQLSLFSKKQRKK